MQEIDAAIQPCMFMLTVAVLHVCNSCWPPEPCLMRKIAMAKHRCSLQYGWHTLMLLNCSLMPVPMSTPAMQKAERLTT